MHNFLGILLLVHHSWWITSFVFYPIYYYYYYCWFFFFSANVGATKDIFNIKVIDNIKNIFAKFNCVWCIKNRCYEIFFYMKLYFFTLWAYFNSIIWILIKKIKKEHKKIIYIKLLNDKMFIVEYDVRNSYRSFTMTPKRFELECR